MSNESIWLYRFIDLVYSWSFNIYNILPIYLLKYLFRVISFLNSFINLPFERYFFMNLIQMKGLGCLVRVIIFYMTPTILDPLTTSVARNFFILYWPRSNLIRYKISCYWRRKFKLKFLLFKDIS